MNDMLPEEQDLQYEELIALLRRVNLNPLFVDSRERTQILAQARARLFPTDPKASQLDTHEMQELGSLQSKPKTGRGAQYRRGRLVHLLNMLAAVLVIAALIGSAILLFGPRSPLHQDSSGAAPPRGPVSTPVVTLVKVPDLRGMSWQDAYRTATHAGFQLKSQDGSTAGVVVNQSPCPTCQASSGTTIEVQMQVQKATVPALPKNSQLATVEQILSSRGFTYRVVPDGTDPTLQPNTVSKIDPPSGSSVVQGSKISIYVVNYTNGTPAVAPSPSPTVKPSPTPDPTPKPSPSPSPTPKPSPSPSPTPSPSPSPSPSPGH
jgi:hypothetical protein